MFLGKVGAQPGEKAGYCGTEYEKGQVGQGGHCTGDTNRNEHLPYVVKQCTENTGEK